MGKNSVWCAGCERWCYQRCLGVRDVLLILEAMKMETEVRAARSGVVQDLHVKEGDSVTVGAPLVSLV